MLNWFAHLKNLLFGRTDPDIVHNLPYHLIKGNRLYAIGDIHGQFDLLVALRNMIDKDRRTYDGRVTLVYLGDYIDRGQQSAKIIDWLIAEQATNIAATTKQPSMEKHYLMGNHEWALLRALAEPAVFVPWLKFGGAATVESYGLNPEDYMKSGDMHALQKDMREAIPLAHIAFYRRLRPYYQQEDFLFVHAGIDPFTDLHLQENETLYNMREPFLSYKKPLDKLVVHGHTISATPEIKQHRIGIDTGAYMKGGCLTALALEGNQARFIQAHQNK